MAAPFGVGPDVSEFQGSNIDWGAVKSWGATFAIARASYGLYHTSGMDQTFPTNAAGIKAAGLIRGAYYYLIPSQDAAAQGRHFVSLLQKVGYDPAPTVEEAFATGKDLPPALDLEATAGEIGSCGNVHAAIHTAAQTMTAAGFKPMLYTYYSWWNEHCGACAACAQHDLWFASYLNHPDPSSPPPVPGAWGSMSLWQYAGTAVSIPGIPGKNDCSWLMRDVVSHPHGTNTDLGEDMARVVTPDGHALFAVTATSKWHIDTWDNYLELRRQGLVANEDPIDLSTDKALDTLVRSLPELKN